MNTLRTHVWAAIAVLIAGALGVASAQADAATSADLPVTRVVLFTSGVGYFEHAGTVTGSQALELPVGTEHMDDLLQSLVLQDLDGGTIRPVRYPSRDPVGRILQGFDLDLSGDPTLADLLSQARGEPVTVEATTAFEGAIVNVERISTEAGPETWLTLSTDEGLARISLAEVRRIQFVDPELQDELEAALTALAEFRGEDTRTVRLAFEGTGEREVRIGYVREMPVWKTSYRLVVGSGGAADLQGWAIFDNPTDMDLTNVELSFVAGQPISFVTGLYEPVYVDRPRVEVSTAPSVVPPQYEESFGDAESRSAADMAMEAAPSPAFGIAPQAAAPRLEGAGVTAMAQGAATGATFVYRVSTPVSVGRHESAMVPIVQQTVEAQRLSVFDESVLPLRPLRGVRIVNDTGLHLAAGTVTVFDDGGFTGNARIADLLPGDTRILTFAVDLETRVETTGASDPERVTAVSIRNGVIETEVRQRARTTYAIDTSADAGRFLVLEHPKRAGFDLVAPEPAPAETPGAYRLGVLMAGGEDGAPTAAADGEDGIPVQLACDADASCELEVVLERVESRTLAVGNVTPDQLGFWLENVELGAEDRATLSTILDLKRQIVSFDRRIADLESRLHEIAQEQSRIRQNMGALDRNSSLYRRYVSDLEAQEDEIDDLQVELDAVRESRRMLQQELDALVASLQPG